CRGHAHRASRGRRQRDDRDRAPVREGVLMTIPLQIEVFDKTFKQVGVVGNPKFATAIPRFMAPGLFTFAIAASHRMVSDLVADGARVRVLDAAGEHVMSGTVSRFAGVGPEAVAMLEF